MGLIGQKGRADAWIETLPSRLGGEGRAEDGESALPLHLGWRELSGPPSMEEIFHRLAATPYACFLDSSLVMERLGRFSFIGYQPFLVLSTRGHRCRWRTRDGKRWETEENPFTALRRALRSFRLADSGVAEAAGLPPFTGGGMGYLAYELGRYIERLPGRAVDDLGLPELCFAFYDRVLAHDHGEGRTWLFVLHPLDPGSVEGEALWWEDAEPPPYPAPEGAGEAGFVSNFTREEYLRAVQQVKEYIYAGDIYQANLSQRFHTTLRDHPWILYRRLRRLNAAPFAAYFNAVEGQVCSSSPERFLKGEGRRVETRPIKGTRRRSEDPEEDRRLAAELMASAKDRAELSMIVDLERNDLGRVCSYGSVTVEEHAVIEHYATVHHLVSTVVGELHPGKDVVDLLRASFPGGSITGAPKIRSMEIIDELEPTARSVYTGSIGYLGFNGNFDLNIAIRTIIVKGNTAYFQVGGGIVADSVPEDEYQETLDKGKAIFASLRGGGT
ncbi:aminodeoxychorismate synthase component I [Candidatus Solincola tengchongensis]|uniref:aminodeoxychorismate synthase component I n=1 Tax=Candidatus Solincola tengchongensis TaxID=2900693 RepID=UPI00257EDDBE|nr:aminodeoxychorismate synthase component I [Candidatus Solincola tengchongensis]